MITPWIDDGRKLPPDLSRPAAANFWRFEGMDRLLTLYKAAWRLKEKAPKSLLALKAEMLDAVTKNTDAQTAAVAAYESRILEIAADVRHCDAAAQSKSLALADLTGTTIFVSGPTPGTAPNDVIFNVKLLNRLSSSVTAVVHTSRPAAPAERPVMLHRYRPTITTTACRAPTSPKPTTVTICVEPDLARGENQDSVQREDCPPVGSACRAGRVG